MPKINNLVVATALEDLSRGERVIFPVDRRRRFALVGALALGAVLAVLVAVGVVAFSGSLGVAVREPALWLMVIAAAGQTWACVLAWRVARERERLVITEDGFFTERRRRGMRHRGASVAWGDLDEIWARWFGAFWATSGSMSVCYSLTPEAELRARRLPSPRREAMRRRNAGVGAEVNMLSQDFGEHQADVLEVLRQAHRRYGPKGAGH